MAYLRNPRIPYQWESDGEYEDVGFRAYDGTLHDSPKKVDEWEKMMRERRIEPAPGDSGAGEKE